MRAAITCWLLVFALQPWTATTAADGSAMRCSPGGVAVQGYDLVSYHHASGPEIGDPKITLAHEGLLYRFANPANRDAFAEDPDRYLPHYLGWCATALAFGRLTCPDPTNYRIENGELLLFEQIGFTNGRVVWETDPLRYRARADGHFLKLTP